MRRCSTNARGVMPADVLKARAKMIEAQLGTPCKVVQVNRPLEIGLNKEVHTPQCRRGEPSAEVRLLGG